MRARSADRQRLAYRVKPQRVECFNSWMSRLLEKHTITLAQLIGHLECDPELAKFDLALGLRAVPDDLYAEFDKFLSELAWSIGSSKHTTTRTMHRGATHDVLPRVAQFYGCPRCWRNALFKGDQVIIKKEWIYRASFWCHEHNLPLHGRASIDACPSRAAKIKRCDILAEKLTKWRNELPIDDVLLRLNREYLALAAKPYEAPQGLSRDALGYFQAFGRNDYHFTKARIQLLLLAHANKWWQANRFNRFLNQSRRQLLSGKRRRFTGSHEPQFVRKGVDVTAKKTVWIPMADAELPAVYGRVYMRQFIHKHPATTRWHSQRAKTI
jgi:hypothetical protein